MIPARTAIPALLLLLAACQPSDIDSAAVRAEPPVRLIEPGCAEPVAGWCAPTPDLCAYDSRLTTLGTIGPDSQWFNDGRRVFIQDLPGVMTDVLAARGFTNPEHFTTGQAVGFVDGQGYFNLDRLVIPGPAVLSLILSECD